MEKPTLTFALAACFASFVLFAAGRGGDPEVHLHTELGEEAKRLATHPREEAHRLSEELKAGEVETTPLIALTGLGIALGLVIALVIALVFVVAYLI